MTRQKTATPEADAAARKHLFHRLSPRLAELDDGGVARLLAATPVPHIWGTNGSVRLGGRRLFVKRLPLTEVEREAGPCTSNLHRLPDCFHYGVGSAGFSVYREILSHIKATHWVLDGACENFPLLYHHRIIPLRNPDVGEPMEGLAGYVKFWNGSKRVQRLMTARADARYEAVLFFEFIDGTMWQWLRRNMHRLDEMIEQVQATLAFLRQQGVAHMDSHLGNILSDGRRFYLSDFEIAVAESFTLDARERAFLRRHRHFDAGNFLAATCNYIFHLHRQLPRSRKAEMARRFDADEELSQRHMCRLLLEKFEAIHDSGLMKLPDNFVAVIRAYGDIAELMNAFFLGQATSNSKDAVYDAARLQRLLRTSGFIDARAGTR